MTAGRLRPTYLDLATHKTLSSAVLEARVHASGQALPTGYRSLRDAVSATGGSILIGDEPGSDAYNSDSPFRMIRTGALTESQMDPAFAQEGIVGVAQYAFVKQDLCQLDLVIAKDGPIGQVAMLAQDDLIETMISSGLVRVRVPDQEFFHLGILKYGSYSEDVDILTPRTSSYRHAGRELILDIAVPDPAHFPDASNRLALLTELVLTCEAAAQAALHRVLELLDSVVPAQSVSANSAVKPTYADLLASGRLDARRHVARFGDLGRALDAVPHVSLRDLERSGVITIRRAQNLQVDAIGFSEKHDDERSGSYRLIEPNMIRRDMTIPRSRWLSCAKKLAVLPDDIVLMSAEGSVGNVTIFREEPGLRTVSNIHAFVIQAVDPLKREEIACWLVGALVWLREKGWLESVSAGGQGGSLGKNYHQDVVLPVLDPPTLAALSAVLVGDSSSPTAPSTEDLLDEEESVLRELIQCMPVTPVVAIEHTRRAAERAIRDLIKAAWPDLVRRL